jgi:hypothetical protein
MKLKCISFAALSIFTVSTVTCTIFQAQLRSAHFYPTTSEEKHSDYTSKNVEVQAAVHLFPILTLWGNYNDTQSYVHTVEDPNNTLKTRLRPVSAGLNLIIPVCYPVIDLYAGFGSSYLIASSKEHATSKKHLGYVAKSGFTFTLKPLFIDLFLDYYHNASVHLTNPEVTPINPITTNGIRLGIGAGITF